MFQQFLEARQLSFEHELEAGTKRPDYWVTTPAGLVVCEVTGMEASLGAQSDKNGGGGFDIARPIERKVLAKVEQGAALAGVAPYVIVVHGPNYPMDPVPMTDTLFGRRQIVIRRGPDGVEHTTMERSPHALFAPDKHRHVSAVAAFDDAAPYRLDQQVRVAIFHNPRATSPLVVGSLTGPLDVEYGVVDGQLVELHDMGSPSEQ
jgi:hypothetical protein